MKNNLGIDDSLIVKIFIENLEDKIKDKKIKNVFDSEFINSLESKTMFAEVLLTYLEKAVGIVTKVNNHGYTHTMSGFSPSYFPRSMKSLCQSGTVYNSKLTYSYKNKYNDIFFKAISFCSLNLNQKENYESLKRKYGYDEDYIASIDINFCVSTLEENFDCEKFFIKSDSLLNIDETNYIVLCAVSKFIFDIHFAGNEKEFYWNSMNNIFENFLCNNVDRFLKNEVRKFMTQYDSSLVEKKKNAPLITAVRNIELQVNNELKRGRNARIDVACICRTDFYEKFKTFGVRDLLLDSKLVGIKKEIITEKTGKFADYVNGNKLRSDREKYYLNYVKYINAFKERKKSSKIDTLYRKNSSSNIVGSWLVYFKSTETRPFETDFCTIVDEEVRNNDFGVVIFDLNDITEIEDVKEKIKEFVKTKIFSYCLDDSEHTVVYRGTDYLFKKLLGKSKEGI